MGNRTHWENVYQTKAPDAVSWYAPHLDTSLHLIRQAAANLDSSIIDIGGGEATLVDDLLENGYQNISVLDISSAALAVAQQRLADEADKVKWIAADITEVELPYQAYDVWHDRAVFHFLTTEEQRSSYVRQVVRSVRPGGHVIIATFGPQGPEKCSGLDVVRYDSAGLHGQFGKKFRLLGSSTELHQTPFGTTQQFLYCYCVVV